MKKMILWGVLSAITLFIVGCTSTKTVDINVLATTDLHGVIPYDLVSYVKKEKEKDKNTLLVDAGDFYDYEFGASEDMVKFRNENYEDYEKGIEKYREMPLAKEMKDAGFDTVTLGNHEFVSNSKKSLDDMISDFEKQGVIVLSANTYNQNGSSYTKPYVIKEIKTPEGNIKVGILGLTIKEVGENREWVDGELVKTKSLELKDQESYKGKLYMNDLVEDAKKWVKVMKEKDNADVIIAVAHTGEKPKKPRHPGNRIQDLATQVDGIDAIVAGHNHVQIKQHDYENKSKEKVIVTEPGNHGECISKINLKLEKDKNNWKVIDKSSDIVQFEESKKNINELCDNVGMFGVGIYENADKIGEKVSLSKITPFKWDKMYVFKVGTPREKIYDKAGYKFLNITESEDMNQFILMNGEKVVYYSGFEDEDVPYRLKFDNIKFKDDVFTIEPGKNDYSIMNKSERDLISNSEAIDLNYVAN